ncbi:MAG TPA: lysophospholipid acyltransferase family protein [Planosporangium sp.]|nr:lysophospholipid acyltransferase family protein [Planosporangium sp.]
MARRRLGFWRRLAVALVKPPLWLMTRRRWLGMEHIPPGGGAIFLANHISHADPFVVAHYVYDAGRWPQFLAKSSLFKIPVLGSFLSAVRQIPVHRGTADAIKALEAAVAAVKDGETVIIYPEGTTTHEPDLWPMRGKTGAARLWLATGAPVIPIVMWGPERIFDPRTVKLRLRPRTPVTVVAGPPLDLSTWRGAEPTAATLGEITEAMMLRLREMLAEIRGGTPPPLYTPTAARRPRVEGRS